MSDFSKCVVYTLQYEGIDTSKGGAYVDHPLDKGGATKYGISLNFAKNVKDLNLMDKDGNSIISKEDIKKLTFDDAVNIYKKYFWDRFGLDEVENNQKAFLVFDASVNHGYKGAAKIVQKSLNKIGFNLLVDGVYGPKTKAALIEADSQKFIQAFQETRTQYYEAIVRANPSQKVFLKGWLNRIKCTTRDLNYV